VGCTTSETVEVDAGDTAPLDLGATLIDVGIARAIDAGVVDGFRSHDTVAIPSIDPTATSLPLCDDPATRVNGLPGRPCAGLDSLCSRGVRTAAGCCAQAPRWDGTGCGDGMACDTGGNCVATTEAPWEANSIVGDQTWLDILTDGEKSLITLEPTGFQARFDDASLVDVRPDDGTKIDVGDVHIAHGRARGLEAVAIAAPDTARRRAVYLLTAAHTADICVVRGDFDTMGPVSADCDSPGATRISCPDGDADTQCLVLEDGGVQISGDDLAMVFEMGTFGEQPPGTDVRRALTVDSLDHRWYTATSGTSARARPAALVVAPLFGCTPAQCTFGQLQFRQQTPSCIGGGLESRACTAFGCWGSWVKPAEICDGRDNNCNGTIDEGGRAVLCNDNVGCTADVCARPWASAPVQCTNTPLAPLCTPTGNPNRQTCILPRCNVDGVAYGSNLSWPGPTAGNRETGIDSNGCSFLQRDDYCTNTWDSCDCNAREYCWPGSNGMDATGCRNTPRMTGSRTGTGVNAWVGNYPCENDGKYCTFPLCCEKDARCRVLELAYPNATERQDKVNECNALPLGVRTLSRTGNYVNCNPITGEQTPPLLCDDANVCTTQTCTEPLSNGTQPWTYLCPVVNVPNGPRLGCNSVVNQGCGLQSCNIGTCIATPTPTPNTTACRATDGFTDGQPSCGTSSCNSGGNCVHSINSNYCLADTLDCTVGASCIGVPQNGEFVPDPRQVDFNGRRGCLPILGTPPAVSPTCTAVCGPLPPMTTPIPPFSSWWQQCPPI